MSSTACGRATASGLIFCSKKVWRENTRGDYYVLDIMDGKLHKLGGKGPESTLMFAKFSPDATKVAYVRGNNIFVEMINEGHIRQITSDGTDTTINGTSDWVYEEELGVRDAFRWSPDGTNIAFWQFDSTGVGTFTLINDTDTLTRTKKSVSQGRHHQFHRADRWSAWKQEGQVDEDAGRSARQPRRGVDGSDRLASSRLQNQNDFLLADADRRIDVRDENKPG